MAYTNVELIRHHLVAAYPVRDRVFDQSLVFDGSDYITFTGGAVEGASFLVKSIQSHEPTRMVVTLNDTMVVLTSSPLVPGSVVIASDSSLGTVYVENVDYAVNYAEGELTIKSGGDLSVSMTVTIWYVAYSLYSGATDYLLQADRGEIKRLAGGDIAAGETVYLDYSPVHQSYTEQVLTNAVAEANGTIEREVDPDGQFGADPTLQAAATYRALEIVCRASAARELSGRSGQDRPALVWMQLADAFADRSVRLLSTFRPPLDGPTAPVNS